MNRKKIKIYFLQLLKNLKKLFNQLKMLEVLQLKAFKLYNKSSHLIFKHYMNKSKGKAYLLINSFQPPIIQ